MSIKLNSVGGGSVTIQEPNTASDFTLSVPAATGSLVLSGTTPSLNGIAFPATAVPSADANTLDDYEEGTWTPTVTPDTGSITSYTSSATYTKIGRLVNLVVYTSITNRGTAGGRLNITNVPFAFPGVSNEQVATICRESNNTGTGYLVYGIGSTSQISIQTLLTNGGISWASNDVYSFTLTYRVS
jgi:hypothetical protein